MLIFSVSDKGGAGRSVTSCNLAHRLSLLGRDVAYLDFDFGSPTAGAIFEIPALQRGTDHGGLHSYILGRTTEPVRSDIGFVTERQALQERPPGSGKLALFPGDAGGAEFPLTREHIKKVSELFQAVEREYDVCIVDLSAGRSVALDMALQATARGIRPQHSDPVRWLLFHRWTTQHVIAAGGLLFGDHGILSCAVEAGHDRHRFLDLVRTVRTAMPDASAFGGVTTAEQEVWLRRSDDLLRSLAKDRGLGQNLLAGTTPLEPMLLWREQVVMDVDVERRLAKAETARAFDTLAGKVLDDATWEGF